MFFDDVHRLSIEMNRIDTMYENNRHANLRSCYFCWEMVQVGIPKHNSDFLNESDSNFSSEVF